MDNTNWLKQTDKPAFADLFWSRPQNRAQSGKLLIVGGSLHSFSALSHAYEAAFKAGIGTARVIVPDVLTKSLAKVFPEAQFAPSTPGGNFARSALAEIIDSSIWADGLLLAGDFGNNSETSVMLEGLVTKYRGPLVVATETTDYIKYSAILSRPDTAIVTDITRLQKLAAHSGVVLKQQSDLMHLVSKLEDWPRAASLVTNFNDFITVSTDNRISTTGGPADLIELAAYCAVWQIWQPAKPFEALTSAAYACLYKN